MKKIIYLVIAIVLLSGCNHEDIYSKDLFYMDTYINIKIFSEDKEKANEALKAIDKMYEEYDKLADRYKAYDGLINVNYINHELALNEDLKIDSKLYDMLAFVKSYKDKTKGLFNIALGNVIDVWSTYRDGEKTGVPSLDELKGKDSVNDEALVLKDNNTILKKENISLDLGAIAKGYVTELAGDYLESIDLHKYLITAGTSSVKTGDHYNDGRYKIGLTDPNKTDDLYKIINGNNIAITTSGSYERYYEYEGVRYHHIIDPHTLFPSNYMLSVTVISKDAALGEILSTTLFLMPINEGREYIKSFDNVEAIWYSLDGEITMSDGMDKYE